MFTQGRESLGVILICPKVTHFVEIQHWLIHLIRPAEFHSLPTWNATFNSHRQKSLTLPLLRLEGGKFLC